MDSEKELMKLSLKNPKVFISHASEDKERFVLDFAIRLYGKGIISWVDKFEMLPGDSLVNKIFEEGIKKADAIIVVLSKNSVHKPWVQEELNAAFVKKINGECRLIPIVLDDCEIPECLKAIVQIRIKNHNNYEADLDRIVNSIYGIYDKPFLGERPNYVQTIVETISDLTKVDSLIFRLSCEKALENESFHIDMTDILSMANSFEIKCNDVVESLEILNERCFVSLKKVLGGGEFGNIKYFRITNYGFDQYARIHVKNYCEVVKSIALEVINDKKSSDSIKEATGQSYLMIEHILDMFSSLGFIKASKMFAGRTLIHIYSFSPELRRRLNQDVLLF